MSAERSQHSPNKISLERSALGSTCYFSLMVEAKSYTGSCHCGAVRYEVTTDVRTIIECNCSMCSRAGTLLNFVDVDRFKLLAGEDALSDYKFHTHRITHTFCKVCGIKPFAKGPDRQGNDTRMVNVRCLDGVDIDALQVTRYDGKHRL